VLLCEVTDIGVIVVGDEELRFALVLLVDLTHEIKQDGMLVGVEVGFRIHAFRSFVGRVEENETSRAGGVGYNVLVITVQDDGISHTPIGIDKPVEPLRHIPSSNAEGLARRREAINLILEECCRSFYLRPFQLADDLGCIQYIVKDVGDVSQAVLVLSEDQFGVDGEIQSPDEEDQFLVALDRPEQIDKVAVVVVEDFSFCLWLSEEDLSAAHTGFNVNAVLRHHCQDRVDDATLISRVGQWAG